MFCLLLNVFCSAQQDVFFDFMGGVVRAHYSAMLLDHLAQSIQRNSSNGVTIEGIMKGAHFSGVSAGAVQASYLACLALGLIRHSSPSTEPIATPNTVDPVQLLSPVSGRLALQQEIVKSSCCGNLFGLCGPTNNKQDFMDVLQGIFGEITLGALQEKGGNLDILVYDMTNKKPLKLSAQTQEHASLKIVDAILASSAYPTAYPPHPLTINGEIIFASDGGLSAQVLSSDILAHQKTPGILAVFGTGNSAIASDPTELQSAGLLGWYKNGIIDLLVKGPAQRDKDMAEALAKKDGWEYHLLNGQLPAGIDSFDPSDANLMRLEAAAKKYIAANQEKFDNLVKLLVENYRKKPSA